MRIVYIVEDEVNSSGKWLRSKADDYERRAIYFRLWTPDGLDWGQRSHAHASKDGCDVMNLELRHWIKVNGPKSLHLRRMAHQQSTSICERILSLDLMMLWVYYLDRQDARTYQKQSTKFDQSRWFLSWNETSWWQHRVPAGNVHLQIFY